MYKRIAYIGLSYPILYDRTRADKWWMGNRGPLPPHPVLEAGIGLMVLYDELWFLNIELCPLNMQRLPYVKYVDEMFPDIDLYSYYKDCCSSETIYTEESRSKMEKLAQQFRYRGNVTGFSLSSTIKIKDDLYTACATRGRYMFDLFVLTELKRRTENSIELISNRTIQFDDVFLGAKEAELTNRLIIKEIPNYLHAYGPYDPCIEDLRNNSNLRAFREWIVTRRNDICESNIDEIEQTVENEINKAKTDLLLKYLDENTWIQLTASNSKTLLDFTLSLTPVGLVNDLKNSLKTSYDAYQAYKTAENLRWTGFVESAKRTVYDRWDRDY